MSIKYEGKEWFNVGTAFLIFAICSLPQFFAELMNPQNGIQYGLLGTLLVYGAGFITLGLAHIFGKPLMAICALITSFFFVMVDIDGAVWLATGGHGAGLGGYWLPQWGYVKLGCSIVAVILLAISVLDIGGALSSAKVKLNETISNIFIFSSFAMILTWLGIRMTGAYFHTGMFSDNVLYPYNYETALFLNITLITFMVLAILTVVSKIDKGEKLFGIECGTWNNIAFVSSLTVLMVTALRMFVSHGYFKILLSAVGLG